MSCSWNVSTQSFKLTFTEQKKHWGATLESHNLMLILLPTVVGDIVVMQNNHSHATSFAINYSLSVMIFRERYSARLLWASPCTSSTEQLCKRKHMPSWMSKTCACANVADRRDTGINPAPQTAFIVFFSLLLPTKTYSSFKSNLQHRILTRINIDFCF